MMNVKQIKRKCSVRGCGNINTFSISQTREHGNTVIMCRSCVAAALEAVNGHAENPAEKKSVDTAVKKPAKKAPAKKLTGETKA